MYRPRLRIAATDRDGHRRQRAAGCRSTASWRWRCTRPAWATTRAATASSAPMPASGSDFVTAPELSPLFGAALARQVAQALEASGTDEVWEFGAGSGALAAQLLDALGDARAALHTSSTCRAACAQRQRERAGSASATRCSGSTRCPTRCEGVVLGNEVLDAMPVQLLHCDGQRWFERGVAAHGRRLRLGRPARPRCARRSTRAFVPGTVTEIHPQAEAFVAHAGRAAASAARRSSSTTASPRPSTTTRSAAAAR